MAEEEVLEGGEAQETEAEETQAPSEVELLRARVAELDKKLTKQTHRKNVAERLVLEQNKILEDRLAKQREKLLRDLEQQRMKAVQDGDRETFQKVDKEMREVEKESSPDSSQPHPEFQRFIEANPWYHENEDMQYWATGYGNALKAKNPNMALRELFDAIATKARIKYPKEFEAEEETSPAPAVEKGGPPAHKAKPSEPGWDMIPKNYREYFEVCWKQGAWGNITKKEAAKIYAQDLIETGVIEP